MKKAYNVFRIMLHSLAFVCGWSIKKIRNCFKAAEHRFEKTNTIKHRYIVYRESPYKIKILLKIY